MAGYLETCDLRPNIAGSVAILLSEELGAESPEDLALIEETDLDRIVADLGLKKVQRSKLKQAWQRWQMAIS